MHASPSRQCSASAISRSKRGVGHFFLERRSIAALGDWKEGRSVGNCVCVCVCVEQKTCLQKGVLQLMISAECDAPTGTPG